MILPREITDYLEIVENRTVPVCKEQIALAAHVRRAFETEALTIDTEKLAHYMSLAKYFPFELYPYENLDMKQNTTHKFSKTRIALVHLLLKVDAWAHTYSDGRGHYPPVRTFIAAVSFSIQRKLLKPMEVGLTKDELDELDNLVYQWS